MVVDFEPSTNRPDMPTAVPKRIFVGASAAAYSFRGRLAAPTAAAPPLIKVRLFLFLLLPFLFIHSLESASRVFRGAGPAPTAYAAAWLHRRFVASSAPCARASSFAQAICG